MLSVIWHWEKVHFFLHYSTCVLSFKIWNSFWQLLFCHIQQWLFWCWPSQTTKLSWINKTKGRVSKFFNGHVTEGGIQYSTLNSHGWNNKMALWFKPRQCSGQPKWHSGLHKSVLDSDIELMGGWVWGGELFCFPYWAWGRPLGSSPKNCHNKYHWLDSG